MRDSINSGVAAEWAFALAFFSLPLSKPLFFSSLFVAGLLFLGSVRFGEALRNTRILPWIPPALILCILPFLSPLVHGDDEARQFNLGYYWVGAAIVYVASSQFRVSLWIKALTLGTFIVFCYVQIRFPGQLKVATGLAALSNYILYSQFLAVGVVLLSVLYRYETSSKYRLLYLVGIVSFFWGLISGDGRSGLLTVIVLSPFILKNLFPRLGWMKIVIGTVLAVSLVAFSPKVQSRLGEGMNDLQLMQLNQHNTSLGYRAEMWRSALNIVQSYPLLGIGQNGFQAQWLRRAPTEEARRFVEPHNAFLFFATSYGLIGLCALIWLYVAILRTGWQARATMEGRVILSFAIILVVMSMTNTVFVGSVSHAWVMVFVGLQGSLLGQRRLISVV